MTQVQIDLSKTEVIEFSVKNEPWIKFRLEDGTLILLRFVITKIYRTGEYDGNGQPIYIWTSQSLMTTVAPKERKGSPSNPLPSSPNPSDYNVTPLDFDRRGSEQWNVYDLEDGTILRIKLEPNSVVRTDKFAADGDPYYIVNSGTISRVKVPSGLLRKQLPKATQQKDIYK